MERRLDSAAVPGDLLADYRVPAGVSDELFEPGGAMRPVWAPFMAHVAAQSVATLNDQFARGDQYLRDAGVFYRQYSSDPHQERDWPLAHVPVLLHADEWATICDGLRERAELLERIVADLYGPARLVADGYLPAELVAQNPEWHRPLVGIAPLSGHFLHFLAFEIGRNPDGSWIVLGDRAQAPSGAGFAVENRIATARIYPALYKQSNALRLAGFFRGFRDAMDALPGAAGRRTALMSPGPGNDTYFEHAYIARYLGLMLLEGEDLVVRDGTVLVRTVSGLQPVGVLWRRLDAAFADPLELDEASAIGTPGLVDALRQGGACMVNALGSGILETRALMAFIPRIAEALLGAPLRMPNVATWWCGQASERAYVKAHVEEMFVGSAFSRALQFDIGQLGQEGAGSAASVSEAWIDAQAQRLVGQEAVTLSTTPAWTGTGLAPRPMSIRVFAARTRDGWTFLPGGYARVGRSAAATALSMQAGGSVADVWVVSDQPPRDDTLLDPASFHREHTAALPSRAADNLFWLGRYVERTEGAIRLLRAYHMRLAELGDLNAAHQARIAQVLGALSVDVAQPVEAAIAAPLGAARACAGKVRDRFSVDGWTALADLTRSLTEDFAAPTDSGAAARSLGVLLRKITGFNGLVHENMHRSSGWRFLTFGRALERAMGAAAVLTAVLEEDLAPGLADLALEYADSRITHQRRYRIEPTSQTLVDLLVLDAHNPRAIQFQNDTMRRIALALPRAEVRGQVSPVLRLLLPLETRLTVTRPDELTAAALGEIRETLGDISTQLSKSYLS